MDRSHSSLYETFFFYRRCEIHFSLKEHFFFSYVYIMYTYIECVYV